MTSEKRKGWTAFLRHSGFNIRMLLSVLRYCSINNFHLFADNENKEIFLSLTYLLRIHVEVGHSIVLELFYSFINSTDIVSVFN